MKQRCQPKLVKITALSKKKKNLRKKNPYDRGFSIKDLNICHEKKTFLSVEFEQEKFDAVSTSYMNRNLKIEKNP